MRLFYPKQDKYCKRCYCLHHVINYAYESNMREHYSLGSSYLYENTFNPTITIKFYCDHCCIETENVYRARDLNSNELLLYEQTHKRWQTPGRLSW